MQPKHRTARLVAAGLAVFALTASACDDDDSDVPASEEEMDEEMEGEEMDEEMDEEMEDDS